MKPNDETVNVDAVIAELKSAFNTPDRQKAIVKESLAIDRCKQAYRDSADGRITEGQAQEYLASVGEPAMLAATLDRQRADQRAHDAIEPTFDAKRRQLAAERDELWAATIAKNAELDRLENQFAAMLPRDLARRRLTCVSEYLPEMPLLDQRGRTAHALEEPARRREARIMAALTPKAMTPYRPEVTVLAIG